MYSNEDYLIELLVESGHLTHDELEKVKGNLQNDESAIEGLFRQQVLSEFQVAQVCAENSGMEFVDLGQVTVPPELYEQIDADVAVRFKVVPVSDDGFQLRVAVADPLNFETLDSLPHVVGRDLEFVCATPSAIRKAVKGHYGGDIGGPEEQVRLTGGDDSDANDAPIIKLVTQLLLEAFKMKASDIHIEPLETSLRVRFRIDGKLVEVDQHPKKLLPAIIARVKVMSGSMSIAEKRLPQDGRVQVRVGEKEVDLRVSVVPSNHGESVVMRILDKGALELGLPKLGFFSDDQESMEELINLPDGIILVTGPTGSGKTTTLYSCLHHINKPDRKIITVEDPVEYELPGINQVMVRTEVGMTFAAALRAMLRQAPNIIMLGEIRDAETATIAINAALTGHLVFSTLHTNDAPSAVARLADIGVKRFLVASAVRAVLAQRLVRGLCDKCKVPAELSEAQLRALGLDAGRASGGQIFGPGGCEYCRGTGYKGRVGIFELFKFDDEVRHMINENLTTPQLRRRARELGMRTLREDGVRKVLAGITSADEVLATTMGDAD